MRQPRQVQRVRARIGAGPAAPARARAALRALEPEVGPGCLDRLELIVSELVTNAVRHAGGAPDAPIALDVRCGEATIRVSVSDLGAGFTPPADVPDPDVLGGWGLYLVAELADAWWVEPGSPTRIVAELAR